MSLDAKPRECLPALALCLACMTLGCGSGSVGNAEPDGGVLPGPQADAGVGQQTSDAAVSAPDAGPSAIDASPGTDAGGEPDATGEPDAGPGPADSGLPASDAGAVVGSCDLTGLKSVAELEAVFLNTWQYEYDVNHPLSVSGDSWKFYDLAYGISANAAMYEATGKTQYLDRALLYVNDMIDSARLSSSIAGSQYRDAFLGWGQYTHPETGTAVFAGQEIPLYESFCWRYVASLLRLMKGDPAVFGAQAYRAQYDRILAFTERNIFQKWAARGMSNIYRSHAHMASHWARICLNLFLISADPSIRQQCWTVFDSFTNGLPAPYAGRSMRGQIIANPRDPSASFWNPAWGNFSQPGQDTSHGNAVISHMTEAYDLGFGWEAADVLGLVNLYDKVIWPTTSPAGACYFNGAMDSNGQPCVGLHGDGLATLGRYDARLQARLQAHPKLVNGQQLAAQVTLNARRLFDSCRP